uniref:CW-type domain-containing protein n=1 Tax=Oryza punctata TaxID=4537 RepID=A0A0E0LDL2_ORYPU
MADETLDLNEPPHENQGGGLNYVLLQKDFKNICRTKVCDIPVKVPSVWSIVRFVPTKVYQQCDFLKFSLLPDPEDDHQNIEWGKFMRFLWDNQRVAVVRFSSFALHISPLNLMNTLTSHMRWSCTSKKILETANRWLEYLSAMSYLPIHFFAVFNSIHLSIMPPEQHMNIATTNALKRSYRSDFQSGSMNRKSYLREEICDSGPNPKEMNASRVTELHKSVPESSPCESVEDGPRILDPIVKKRTTTPAKNFVSTDPSYLRTLSQTRAGWVFGAIAELIDNSRDADASRLNISVKALFSKKAEKKIPVLSVIDDGHGMTCAEMMRMISFGHKRPDEHRQDQIGRFGIGFKTGAMKLGRDAIVLTQTSSSRSVAFLSQSFNESKDNLEIPVVTYRKKGQYMEVDSSVQSEATAEYNLNAIKEFSPFNEYFIGEKLGIFGEDSTGTQIYIWNLDRWGADYTLDWSSGKPSEDPVHHGRGDILIRSRRVRLRPGQTSNNVPLDYSLQSYLEVMFLNPQMKISVQGSLVKTRPLAKTLNKTSVISGEIMGRTIQLTLGRSNVEWDRMNCGVFLYWHGRLIESYKRVGGQKHNADMGRGVIGVADITDLIDDEDGNSWVLNSKQGFQDCEMYAKLEEWLGRKADEYWDTNFDTLELRKGGERYKADHEWVQCYSCRKWRILNAGFDTKSLPDEWFCYMPPFNGKCEVAEQQMARGVIVIGEKRSEYDGHDRITQQEEVAKVNTSEMRSDDSESQKFTQDEDVKDVKLIPMVVNKRKSSNGTRSMDKNNSEDKHDDAEGESSQTQPGTPRPVLKRIRRGPARSCKQS